MVTLREKTRAIALSLAIVLTAAPAAAQVRLEARQGTQWAPAITISQAQAVTFRWLWAGTRPPARAERQIWVASTDGTAPPTSIELGMRTPARLSPLPALPAERIYTEFTVGASDLPASLPPTFYVRVRVDWTGGGAAVSSWAKVAVSQPAPTPQARPTVAPPTRAGTVGTIVGVAIDPQPITQGVPATIVIAGFGSCGQIAVSFGDGKSATLTSVSLPHNLQHTYYQVGSTTVTVKPVTGCKGEAGATGFTQISPIWSALPDLCAIAGCADEPQRAGSPLSPKLPPALIAGAEAAPTCPSPTLTGVDMTPPIEPGEELIVSGCGFGTSAQLRLVGEFPGGYLVLQTLDQVGDVMRVRVPPITKVKDQDTKLQLLRKDLKLSNQIGVRFLATRVVVSVPASAVTVACSDASNSNDCHLGGSDSYGAFHSNWAPAVIAFDQTDAGMDWFVLVLKNGWVLHSKSFDSFGGGSASFGGAFSPGAAAAVLMIKWSVDFSDNLTYFGQLRIRGPAGIPYQ